VTALKAHEVKRFLDRPDIKDGVFLSYGPDAGLVHETAMRIVEMMGGDAQIISVDAAEAVKEPDRIIAELTTLSMFGGKRIVRIRGTAKGVSDIVKTVAPVLVDAALIIEADNLLPRDPLRIAVEGLKNGRALPCYADSADTIASLIKETFVTHDIQVTTDAEATLLEILGNDREVTRRELEKLCLYAGTPGRLTRDDIFLLCADNGMMAIDSILDAAGNGDVNLLEKSLARAQANAVDPQRILIMTANHFAQLRRWRVEVDNGRSPGDVLDSTRPKPHFSRKNSLINQLRIWNDEKLAAAGERLLQATSESRRYANLAETVIARALLAVARMAARAPQR